MKKTFFAVMAYEMSSDECSVNDCESELEVVETEVQLGPTAITPYDFEPETSA